MLAASVHVSDPRRGDLQVHRSGINVASDAHRQPGFRRRHRRRADHHRRGLWRRLLDHAGALPRLRDEVAGLAARPAARTCRRSSRRSRTASSFRRPRNTPVMLEVRIRACHVHGRFVAKDNKRPSLHACARRWKIRAATPTASCCRRPPTCTSRRRSSSAGRRRSNSSRSASSTNSSVPRSAEVGIVVQGGMYNARHARAAAARARRRLRRDRGADLRAQRHLSADRRRGRRVLPSARRRSSWSRRASPNIIEQALQHDPAPPRHPDQDRRQGRAADGRRIHARRWWSTGSSAFLEPHAPDAARQPAADARRCGRSRAIRRSRSWPRRCRRGRPASASAARSGRSSPR